MIVNHKYKFIYLKTRKTASTSIEIALRGFCDKNDIITKITSEDEATAQERGALGPQNYRILNNEGGHKKFENHSNALFVKNNLGGEKWESYFKFCFERDPFDKAVSRYYWDKENFKRTYEERKKDCIEKNIDIPEYKPFREINDYLSSVEEKFLSSWNIYTIDDQIAVDCIGRYESLPEDLEKIRNELELPEEINLPDAKSGYRPNNEHYSQILNRETRSRIECVCAREIQTFNYYWTDN
ncbi:MAG: sulfotransferase family 2 domain-containing protein [Cyanobacteria bacterium P01_B01_bin.77]